MGRTGTPRWTTQNEQNRLGGRSIYQVPIGLGSRLAFLLESFGVSPGHGYLKDLYYLYLPIYLSLHIFAYLNQKGSKRVKLADLEGGGLVIHIFLPGASSDC